MTEPTDGHLVGMTRGGDREAYGALVSRYQGHVYGLANSLVGNWADAQDIAQETFIRAYMNLDQLRENLKPILLRRTRGLVMRQLPERMTEIVRIAPTDEQLELHGAHMRIVSSVVRKPYISEMDLLRLQKALLMCRMAANSSFLVDKQEPGYSSKLERLDELFDEV